MVGKAENLLREDTAKPKSILPSLTTHNRIPTNCIKYLCSRALQNSVYLYPFVFLTSAKMTKVEALYFNSKVLYFAEEIFCLYEGRSPEYWQKISSAKYKTLKLKYKTSTFVFWLQLKYSRIYIQLM